MHHEEIELATEVEDEVEEALEEVEDQWYSISVNNQYIMQENSHFNL
jgi:plasmid maintenance system killer protein